MTFNEESYFANEARRMENDEFMASADYDGSYDCLEDELDAAFGDDEFWSDFDDEFDDDDDSV